MAERLSKKKRIAATPPTLISTGARANEVHRALNAITYGDVV